MLLNHKLQQMRKIVANNDFYKIPKLSLPELPKFDDFATALHNTDIKRHLLQRDKLNHDEVRKTIGGALSRQQQHEQDLEIRKMRHKLINNKLQSMANSHSAEVAAGYYKPAESVDASFISKIKEDFLKLINNLKNNNVNKDVLNHTQDILNKIKAGGYNLSRSDIESVIDLSQTSLELMNNPTAVKIQDFKDNSVAKTLFSNIDMILTLAETLKDTLNMSVKQRREMMPDIYSEVVNQKLDKNEIKTYHENEMNDIEKKLKYNKAYQDAQNFKLIVKEKEITLKNELKKFSLMRLGIAGFTDKVKEFLQSKVLKTFDELGKLIEDNLVSIEKLPKTTDLRKSVDKLERELNDAFMDSSGIVADLGDVTDKYNKLDPFFIAIIENQEKLKSDEDGGAKRTLNFIYDMDPVAISEIIRDLRLEFFFANPEFAKLADTFRKEDREIDIPDFIEQNSRTFVANASEEQAAYVLGILNRRFNIEKKLKECEGVMERYKFLNGEANRCANQIDEIQKKLEKATEEMEKDMKDITTGEGEKSKMMDDLDEIENKIEEYMSRPHLTQNQRDRISTLLIPVQSMKGQLESLIRSGIESFGRESDDGEDVELSKQILSQGYYDNFIDAAMKASDFFESATADAATMEPAAGSRDSVNAEIEKLMVAARRRNSPQEEPTTAARRQPSYFDLAQPDTTTSMMAVRRPPEMAVRRPLDLYDIADDDVPYVDVPDVPVVRAKKPKRKSKSKPSEPAAAAGRQPELLDLEGEDAVPSDLPLEPLVPPRPILNIKPFKVNSGFRLPSGEAKISELADIIKTVNASFKNYCLAETGKNFNDAERNKAVGNWLRINYLLDHYEELSPANKQRVLELTNKTMRK